MEREVCTCDEMGPYDEHTCPFAEVIHGDYESLCTCCPECEYQCAMDRTSDAEELRRQARPR